MPFVLRGDVGEIGIRRGSSDIDGAIPIRFFDSFGRPLTGIDVVRFCFAAQQVHRHHGKLTGSAALQK